MPDTDNKRLPPSGRTAFTLVELLVAMVVTILLVVVLTQVFNGAARTWQHSEAQIDAYREARGALQIMARDLSSTLSPSYAQPGGTVPTNTSPLVPTLCLQRSTEYPSENETGGPTNEEVYCLTNLSGSGSSSLCAVGYFCVWLPDYLPLSNDGIDHRPRAYALMRQSLDSNGTYQRLQAAAAQTTPLTFEKLFSRAGTPAASVTQLASYVWDLKFRIDTDLNDSSISDGNAPTAPADHSTSPVRYYNATGGLYPPLLPAYIEIRFKALSDQAARRLEGSNTVSTSTWTDTDSTPLHQQIIQPNFQQFVLRVPLTGPIPQ